MISNRPQLPLLLSVMLICGLAFCENISAQSCTPPPANLVSFYPGDRTPNDLQGPNNGIPEGTATYGQGLVGPAFSFDGSGDVALPSINLGPSFTVEFWMNPSALLGFQHMLSNAFNSTNYGALYLSGSSVQYWQGNIPGSAIIGGTVAVNTWNHVAVTYDGNAGAGNRFARIYLNGVQVAVSADHSETFNNAVKIGFANPAESAAFRGRIDEVSLYNRALSLAEIQAIFNAGNAGKCIAPGLVIDDVTVTEGNSGTTPAVFNLSGFRLSTNATIDYTSVDNTANAGSDFGFVSGQLTFTAPAATRSVTVQVNGDTTFEQDETFFINLSNPTNVILFDNQAVGTIINDECFGPPSNIVSWWTGENNANDIVSGNNGTLENGAGFASGQVGQAFNFSGSNSVLLPSINIGPTFSVELWVFPTVASGFQHLVSNGFTSTNYGALYYHIDRIEYWQNGGLRATSGAVPLNTWTHVALTYDGSVDRIFINGVLSVTSLSHPENFNNALRFGYAITASDSRFVGRLDEISLYSRALTPLEIQSLYSTHNTGKCSVTPNLLINDISLVEGNAGTTSAVFTVSLTQPANVPVTVDYQTADGTAVAPGDYLSQAGTLMIPANTMSATISVPINGDATFELDENFFVNLSNATNANIIDSQGAGTIVNDDCFTPPAGQVSWWRAENDANDAQSGNNGVLENGATFDVGQVGQAFKLDGVNDSILTPTINVGNAFTVELWIFPTTPTGSHHLVSNSFTSTTNYGALYLAGNRIRYLNNSVDFSSPAVVQSNQWTHVALTYDGTAAAGNRFARIYINGTLAATSPDHIETFNNAVRFGFSILNSDLHFPGRLDEISLYNRALAPSEILSIFSAHGVGKCTLGGNPANWTGATNSDWHNPGNWSNGLIPGPADDAVIPGGAIPNEPSIINGNAPVHDLSITAGRVLTVNASRTLSVFGSLTNSGVLTGGGTTDLTGPVMLNTNTVSVSTFNFANSGAQSLGGSGTFQSNTVFVKSGSILTMQNDHLMNHLVIQAGGSMDISGRALQMLGSLTNAGVLSVGGSTILANGSSPQTLVTSSFNGLLINNPAGVTLGANATVSSTLTLNTDLFTGSFTLSVPSSAITTGSGDVIGNIRRTGLGFGALTYGNQFNLISFQSGTVPTDITVNLVKSPPVGFSAAVSRTYTITQNGGSNFTASLRLHYLDSELGSNSEGPNLSLWRFDGIRWVRNLPSSFDVNSNWVQVNNITAFSPWTFNSTVPSAAPGNISGRITSNGMPLGGVLVTLTGGSQLRRTITDNEGNYAFNSLDVNHLYSLTPALANYAFSPASLSFPLLANRNDAVFNGILRAPTENPLETNGFFVRQQYLDFLGREPDQQGWEYWTDQLDRCGADRVCMHARRIAVSNAFFYEAEYQRTGAFVYRLYRAAFGNDQPFSNADPDNPVEARKLPGYSVFVQDRSLVTDGVNLREKQLALANAFVTRSAFLERYPTALSAAQFVDALLNRLRTDSGADLTSERNGLIELYNASGRGAVLFELASDDTQNNRVRNQAFIDSEYNRSFVYTQYAGYLRRDADIGGFLFWLDQVNHFSTRNPDGQHAMVCAFVTSAEYQRRFSPVVAHANSECGP